MTTQADITALAAIRMPTEGLEAARYVDILDQLSLPYKIHWDRIETAAHAFDAIKTMRVRSDPIWRPRTSASEDAQIRGAPAIASLAALGIALELLAVGAEVGAVAAEQPVPRPSSYANVAALRKHVTDLAAYLLTSRPTAVNLREALDRIKAAVAAPVESVAELRKQVVDVCVTVWAEDVERNHRIGDNGARWLLEMLEADGAIRKGDKVAVLTVCNTGSLATSGYGTALGMIASLHTMGRLEHAYYAQTGPYQQGARLTSLELNDLGIPATMCLDTAVAALLAGEHGRRVHAFIAGADRVVANGDTANKISTFQIATLCHAVPLPPAPRPRVVICAPLTTLDLSMATGKSIHIEIRPEVEAKTVRGRPVGQDADAELLTVQFAPDYARVWNPAFDVTPARLIDAVVTEVGVAMKVEGEQGFDLAGFIERAVRR